MRFGLLCERGISTVGVMPMTDFLEMFFDPEEDFDFFIFCDGIASHTRGSLVHSC